ncbi:MAG: MerR family transcriptional regulator [Clostridia bacterium]|nr:MerR family transcriptional regulator [Clostridia bacterium]
MYKIGELSALCSIPVKTLRFYDNEGILIPEKIDPFTGYRYYSASQLSQCLRIITLKDLGFTLGEIRELIKAPIKTEAILQNKIQELKEIANKTQRQIGVLEMMTHELRENSHHLMHLVQAKGETMKAACITGIFKNRAEVKHELDQLRESIPQSIRGNRSLIIAYELDYADENIHCSICCEITGNLPIESEIQVRLIPLNGDYASVTGSKDQLAESYRSLLRQMAGASLTASGAFYEICYDDGSIELKIPIYQTNMNEKNEDSIMNNNTIFENDPDVIGKWKIYDKLPSPEMFSPLKSKCSDKDDVWLKEIYFLPGGEGYWIFNGWTKGKLIEAYGYPKKKAEYEYTIEKHNDKQFLFLRLQSGCDIMPEYLIYEKVSDRAYTKEDIRVKDNVEILFESDDQVLGNWYAYDFVPDIDEFDSSKRNWQGDLFFKKITFQEDGSADCLMGEKTIPYRQNWTRGTLLDKRNQIAEAYTLMNIDGREYLFVEWKSGDYIFAKRAPLYYVFIR